MNRIEGKISEDGAFYELRQGDQLLKQIPIEEARDSRKHRLSVERNGWEKIE